MKAFLMPLRGEMKSTSEGGLRVEMVEGKGEKGRERYFRFTWVSLEVAKRPR